MNHSIRTIAAFFVLLAMTSTSAFAVGLTEADHAYLEAQDVGRDSPVIRGLSPKEQARLHALINESKTDSDLPLRAKLVREILMEFEKNQPGKQ